MGFVELQSLSELLEELQDIVTCLVLDSAHEHRPEQVIINLDVVSVSGQHYKALSILLETLAPLQEEHELFKDLGRHMVIILQEVLHGLTKQYRVLLVDTNEHYELQKIRLDVLDFFKFKHVLDDLLVVLLLGVQCHSLEQGAVDS